MHNNMLYLIYIFGHDRDWAWGNTLPSCLPEQTFVKAYEGRTGIENSEKVGDAANNLVKKLQGKTVEEAKDLLPKSLL